MAGDDRYRRVLIDLAVLVTPDGHDRQALLHYLDRDGIEILVRTSLDRRGTRHALRRRDLLRYIDDILYPEDPEPEEDEALRVTRPADCTYSHIAEHCIREDRRPFPLELDAF